MDIKRVDNIIQYALCVAADEDDYRDRELGPIHLIKYVYLADLAFAERNEGRTYTEIPWTFYHFGPWSIDVFHRLDIACEAAHAEKRIIPSQYKDDFTRWRLTDNSMLKHLEQALPATVTLVVKRLVHKFGSDTAGLLHYVYTTKPMLKAAPNERLDFSDMQDNLEAVVEEDLPSLSCKAQKRRSAALQDAKAKIQQKLSEKRLSGGEFRKRQYPFRKPRFDEVYFAGMEWLDGLAGSEVKELKGEAAFSSEIWKSKARFDPELS